MLTKYSTHHCHKPWLPLKPWKVAAVDEHCRKSRTRSAVTVDEGNQWSVSPSPHPRSRRAFCVSRCSRDPSSKQVPPFLFWSGPTCHVSIERRANQALQRSGLMSLHFLEAPPYTIGRLTLQASFSSQAWLTQIINSDNVAESLTISSTFLPYETST